MWEVNGEMEIRDAELYSMDIRRHHIQQSEDSAVKIFRRISQETEASRDAVPDVMMTPAVRTGRADEDPEGVATERVRQ